MLVTAWSCVRGASGWISGKGPRGCWDTEQALQGMVIMPRLPELQERLDSTSRDCWGSVQGQGWTDDPSGSGYSRIL